MIESIITVLVVLALVTVFYVTFLPYKFKPVTGIILLIISWVTVANGVWFILDKVFGRI
jgi:hypothetical protein